MDKKTIEGIKEQVVLSAEEKLLRSWRDSPIKFVEEALDLKGRGYKITKQQLDGLNKIKKIVNAKRKAFLKQKLSIEEEEYSKKIGVSIMSGKGTGKDCFGAWVILWFLSCFPYPKIGCTANTRKQLRDVLWSEIAKWLRNSVANSWLVWQVERIFHKEHRGEEWFATARTINLKAGEEAHKETLSGLHSPYLLYVIDEASGIPEAVFEPIETTLTGKCNFVLLIFNPTRNRGFAIDSQTKFRKNWICLQWNSEESELITKDYIKYMSDKYGRDSNIYRIYVLGKPPLADEDVLIPWEWVMNSVEKEFICDNEPLIFGVDVGAGGDKSIILHRRGGKVERIVEHNTKNTMELVGWICMEIEEFSPDGIYVDLIGLGNGVFNRLRELGHRVYPVDVRNNAKDKHRFVRLRDELWWKMREQFENGSIGIINDDELIGELSTIKYEPLSDGRIKVEGKKELKVRGLKSPNKADALMLTYYLEDSIFNKEVLEEERERELLLEMRRRERFKGINPITGY